MTTAWVEVGVKSSIVKRGVNLGGRPQRREVFDAKKSLKNGGGNKNLANKMTSPTVYVAGPASMVGLGASQVAGHSLAVSQNDDGVIAKNAPIMIYDLC